MGSMGARAQIPDVVVVKAARHYHADNTVFVNELLAQWTGLPLKVCDSAIERAVDHDVIDYGVSMRTAWPTPKGEQLLTMHFAP